MKKKDFEIQKIASYFYLEILKTVRTFYVCCVRNILSDIDVNIVCNVFMLCIGILTFLSPNFYFNGYMFTENKTRMVCYLYGSHKYIGNNIVVLIYCYPGEK